MAGAAPLVDLLLLRGQVLGRIADYERAAELAEALVRDAPDDGAAWLARARTRATFHRFPEALADLDAAGRRGADRAALDAERAAILQAVGCYAEALVLRRTAAERRPDFATLGALAVLQAERGEVTEAERLFTEARRRYRGVSPFPVAELDFRRGLMWLGERRPPRGPCLVRRRRAPGACLCPGAGPPRRGRRGPRRRAKPPSTACALWPCPATTPSTRPPSPACCASAGRPQEAEQWRVSAAARYEELVARHPEAFAHHAADFWLTVGGDRSEGLRLLNAGPCEPLRHHHSVGSR